MNIVPRKPYRILTGDVREMLRTMPDESVYCVVTSPPYWGLRDYGTAPQVWGGDPACEHEWGAPIRTAWANAMPGPSDNVPKNSAAGHHRPKQTGPHCVLCRAWRGSLGLEPTIDLYVEHMVEVFHEVRRVLRKDGTLWLNMGDCYAGSWGAQSRDGSEVGVSAQQIRAHPKDQTCTGSLARTPGLKPKDLVGQPWRVAFALQADGWYLRSDIIWAKPNPMPESCTDRPTKSHEYVFLLTKAAKYFFDQEAVREQQGEWDIARNPTFAAGKRNKMYPTKRTNPHSGLKEVVRNPAGRNIRSVWTIPTQAFPDAHFATFPEALPERCIRAGTSERGCCPECGAPWVRVVEKSGGTIGKAWTDHSDDAGKGTSLPHKALDSRESRASYKRETIGWQPSCDHDGTPIPCTVLDPFVGSGTTALVAVRLGRRAIGIDLSSEYTDMVEKQLAVTAHGDSRRPRKFRLKGRKKIRRRIDQGT